MLKPNRIAHGGGTRDYHASIHCSTLRPNHRCGEVLNGDDCWVSKPHPILSPSFTHRASRSDSRRARMSLTRTGPLTLRMMEREVSSMNSTRTWVTPPREPVRPRTCRLLQRGGDESRGMWNRVQTTIEAREMISESMRERNVSKYSQISSTTDGAAFTPFQHSPALPDAAHEHSARPTRRRWKSDGGRCYSNPARSPCPVTGSPSSSMTFSQPQSCPNVLAHISPVPSSPSIRSSPSPAHPIPAIPFFARPHRKSTRNGNTP